MGNCCTAAAEKRQMEESQSCGCCCAPETNQKSCCVCRPFKDNYMTSAQILSILGLCMSWVWWLPFLISFPIFFVLQASWCCRLSKCGVLWMLMLSVLTSVLNFVAGTYVLIAWRSKQFCSGFEMTIETNNFSEIDFDESDHCSEVAFATSAFVDALLYAIASYCLYVFLYRRYDVLMAQIQAELEAEDNTRGLEMAVASPVSRNTFAGISRSKQQYPSQTARAQVVDTV